MKNQFRVSYILSILLFLLSVETTVFAGDTTKVHTSTHANLWHTLGSDIGIFFTDWGRFLTYPLHASGKDWLIGTGAVGIGALSSLADKKVTENVSRGGKDDYHHDFWDLPTGYGYVLYPGAAAGGIYLIGWLGKNDKLRITGRMLIESIGYAGTLSYALKFVIGRQRPYITDDPFRFKGFQTNEDYQSFPSGHTTVAFAVSTVLAERIDTWWSRVLFYSAAGLTGYARIHNNMHWLSDTFFGGLIGFGSGWFVVHNENSRNKRHTSGGRLSLTPSINGINLNYLF